MILFLILVWTFAWIVFPIWGAWRHFDLMENDPEYRREWREKR